MATPIDIRTDHLRTVHDVLARHLPDGVKVWVFGSRATWATKDSSDLDLALEGDGEIPPRSLAALDAAFEDSDLPFTVDVVDVKRLGERFRRIVTRQRVPLPEGDRRSRLNETNDQLSSKYLNGTVAEACSAIDYGLTASASNQSSGLKFLRITDIVAGQIDWSTVPYVVVDGGPAKKYRLHDGDIVLARTGASTGVSAYIKNPPPAVFASYLVRLRAKPSFDPRFLAYYLKSERFRQYIRGVLGDKSAQPNASASTMTAAPFRAPRNLSQQRAIAHILGTLDDKIELNRRMNATLEAMARALFKSWFVDFDPVRAKMEGRDTGLSKGIANLFPDRLVDSELGDIPEGWTISELGDMIELVYGRALTAKARNAAGGVPVFGSNGQIGWHNEALVDRPGIVVGRKGNPGTVTLSPTEFFSIDTTFYVVPKHEHSECLYFLFFALQDQDLPSVAADSAVPGLNRNLAYMNKQLRPPTGVVECFDRYVSTMYARCRPAAVESRLLDSVRDTLLPQFMSEAISARGIDGDDLR